MAGKRKRTRVDWKKARKLYERDGKTYTEIGKLLGCTRQTVSRHAEAEGWVNRTAIERATHADRAEKIYQDFIDQDVEAVRENLATKHRVTSKVLRILERHVDRLDVGTVLIMEKVGEDPGAPVIVEEDPLAAVRRVTLAMQNVEVIDRNLAGLKGDGWKSESGSGASASEDSETAVRRALDRLAPDGPRRGKARRQGPRKD